MAAAVLVLITILLIRQLSSRDIVSEGLESSHEGEAAAADDAMAGEVRTRVWMGWERWC